MVIILFKNSPFDSSQINRNEWINEVVIIIFIYHVILLSDMIPQWHSEFKRDVSISLICFMTITLVIFLFQILKPVFFLISGKLTNKYDQTKAKKRDKINLEWSALAVLVHLNYLVKLRDFHI